MDVRHQRGHPAHVEVYATRTIAPLEALPHIPLYRRLPEAAVGGVDRELLGFAGETELMMAEHLLAQTRVEREAVRPAPDGEHKHRTRAIDRIAGAHL